eukprot:scaffold513117_cov18-Prasinocladus_malaysianus.AAC.2
MTDGAVMPRPNVHTAACSRAQAIIISSHRRIWPERACKRSTWPGEFYSLVNMAQVVHNKAPRKRRIDLFDKAPRQAGEVTIGRLCIAVDG